MEGQENSQNKDPVVGGSMHDKNAKATKGSHPRATTEGVWEILFSHPSDFKPANTAEVQALAVDTAFIENQNAKLIGLSGAEQQVDPEVARKKNEIYLTELSKEPQNQEISESCGLDCFCNTNDSAFRAIFFIDPKREIRLIMYYPAKAVRSMSEIKKALVSLQFPDGAAEEVQMNGEEKLSSTVLPEAMGPLPLQEELQRQVGNLSLPNVNSFQSVSSR